MSLSRNAPCHCGSGRKYKHCCYRRDRAADAGSGRRLHLPEAALARARAARIWQADLLPFPAEIERPASARPVIPMVVAAEIVLEGTMESVRTSEPDELAQVLLTVLSSAADRVGSWPPVVRLRHAAFADALHDALTERGCVIEIDPVLDELDEAARALFEGVVGEVVWPPANLVQTWAAWGLPREDVAALFRAIARLHRARPWRFLSDDEPLWVDWPDGRESAVSVLGASGLEYGLVIYSDPDDFFDLLATEDPREAMAGLQSWCLHVGSVERRRLPPPMQREILAAGWEVASPSAYPWVMPFLTPGGGLSTALVRDATAVIEAIAELTERHADALESDEPFVFGAGGFTLTLPPRSEPEGGIADEILPELREQEFESEADLQAWLSERMERHNRSPQPELSGLSPDRARALLDGDWASSGPLRIATDLKLAELEPARFVHNARVMLRALRDSDGTPATSSKPGNLTRAFVAEMLENMWLEEHQREAIRRFNGVVNEQDAGTVHIVRVVLETAKLVQRRKRRFRATRAGVELAEDVGAGHLTARLFRTFFRDFNLSYLDRDREHGELQYLVPIHLWRIGVEARDWIGARALAERILGPGLLDEREERTIPGSAAGRLERRVIEPLVDFGVLEARDVSAPGVPWWRREIEVRVGALFDRLIRFEWER